MKKFTLSNLTDSDSNKSTNTVHNVNNCEMPVDLPKITELTVFIVDLHELTMLKVIGDAPVIDIKRKLLQTFGNMLYDSQNMGLYLPDEETKLGKFLEEERLLSEYASSKTTLKLELLYKQKVISRPSIPLALLAEKYSKNIMKSIMRYVNRGDCGKIEKLLQKGLDPNFHFPKTGETPLTTAVTRPKPYNMISTLISGGAFKDFRSLNGLTPLHKAVVAGNFEAVKTLLDFGQSPNCVDSHDLTPLYYNVLHDPDTKICHSLLYEHSRIGVTNKSGLHEIHQAACLNRIEQINLLLMYGADVNVQCKHNNNENHPYNYPYSCVNSVDGDTPLHLAVRSNQRAAALRLLSWGADPNLLNSENVTAIQVAQANNNSDLAELIRLFRGSKDNSDIFLPTPTYNPHRRIRHTPVNSYITEPIVVQKKHPYHSPIKLQAHNDKSLTGTPPKMLSNQTNLDRNNHIVKVNARRLIPRANSLNELTGMTKVADIANAVDTRVDTVSSTCATLTRPIKPKLVAKVKETKSCYAINNEDGYGSSLMTKSYTSISQMGHTRQPVVVINKRPAKAVTIDTRPFVRDTSQYDSGIYIPTDPPNRRSIPPCKFHQDQDYFPHNNNNNNNTKNRYSQEFPSKNFTLDASNPKQPPSHQRHQTKQHSPFRGQQRLLPKYQSICTMTDSTDCQIVSKANENKVFEPQRKVVNKATTLVVRKTVPNDLIRVNNSRTIVLKKSTEQQSFGLSIRTTKFSPTEFTPTLDKPSLQTIKRIQPNSLADKAGVRIGDFVLKINGSDVSKASLDQVIELLSSSLNDTVVLTLVTPTPKSHTLPTVIPISERQIQWTEFDANYFSNTTYCCSDELGLSKPIKNSRMQNDIRSAGGTTSYQCVSSPNNNNNNLVSINRNSNSISVTDEGIWSQSNCTSARSSSSSTPYNPTNKFVTITKINEKIEFTEREQCHSNEASSPPESGSYTKKLHRHRLPRSHTTTAINEGNTDKENSTLYFPHNHRFHRFGSQDSQSSASSASARLVNCIDPALRKHLNVHLSKATSLVDKRCATLFSGTPTHLVRRPISLNQEEKVTSNELGVVVNGESPPGSEVLLPPPAEFRE